MGLSPQATASMLSLVSGSMYKHQAETEDPNADVLADEQVVEA